MTRPLLSVALILASCTAAAAAETTPAELLARAKAARAAAEADLADTRQRNLTQRKALAADLQQAYAALSAARAEAKAAAESLDRLTAASAELHRDAALAGRRGAAMIAQAAASAGVTVAADAPIDQAEGALWAGHQRRLDAIDADLTATVADRRIIGRDGEAHRVSVLRWGGFASYACGDRRETRGLLTTAPDGTSRVVGPYLDAAGIDALDAVAAGGLTHVPIDVDGSLRDRAPAEEKTLMNWLAAGKLFIYPILIVGAVGAILILERLAYLLLAKTPKALVPSAMAALARRDLTGARKLLSASRTPTARVLLAGIDGLGKPAEQREAAIESALLAEAPKLERSLSLLAALAGVAPLLGLLGTVSGMIATFDTISSAGTGNPRLLSGGISEALITTQVGLMVAIPLLLAHAGLQRWATRREAMLEYDAIRVLGLHGRDIEEDRQ